jgi:hypothetical protein
VGASIVLIDGDRLTSLVIEHGVAVEHYRTVRLPRVDLDFFDLPPGVTFNGSGRRWHDCRVERTACTGNSKR